MRLPARFRKAALATFFGWLAGLVAAMPFQIVEAIRNAGADSRLLVSALSFTLGLWIVLTLGFAAYILCLFLLPVVWMVSPSWIVRHRALWITLSGMFGVLLMAVRAHVWTSLEHDGVSLINFWMWAVFASAFFLTTSILYAKFVKAAVTSSPAS